MPRKNKYKPVQLMLFQPWESLETQEVLLVKDRLEPELSDKETEQRIKQAFNRHVRNAGGHPGSRRWKW